MIIKNHQDNGGVFPNTTLNDWRAYVLLHFNAEPYKVQQMFWDSFILPCLKYFKERYGIEVWLFNAYRYEQEMSKISALGEEAPIYYLVYWGEHVFPCVKDKLEEIVKFQREKFQRLNSVKDQLFVIVPPIFKILHMELRASMVGRG